MSERPPWWTSDEWETPWEIIQGFEEEFGIFSLDPCARTGASQAARFYTKEENGLLLPWDGRVWLNPPYSNPLPWVMKAVEETKSGRASLVVACLPCVTDTAWFHEWVLPYAELRFHRGRIRFLGWEGTPIRSPKGGTIFAIYRASTLPRSGGAVDET